MRLKKYYASREVVTLTGLTAKQLQWWDHHRLLSPAIAPHRTAAGGFTERRYSPLDLLELLVLADLRRKGFTLARIRLLVDTLRDHFGVRLFEATGDEGPLTLLTDGHEVYARMSDGRFFNVLKDPSQPLLVVGGEESFKMLSSRARPRKRPKRITRRRPNVGSE
jgi:DNA-binding transcriptional MerR regulator